ncbi:hypothetical protein GCM10023170_000810 [Phytohabitans houttuyneae]
MPAMDAVDTLGHHRQERYHTYRGSDDDVRGCGRDGDTGGAPGTTAVGAHGHQLAGLGAPG